MKRLIIKSTWFQVIWFMAVIGAESLQYVTLSLVFFTLVISSVKGEIAWKKVVVIAALGTMLDYFHMAVGWFEFANDSFPLWLIALWFIFSWYASFLSSLLNQYPIVIVSLVGGVAGSLSYIAGEKFGGVTFSLPLHYSALMLALEWTCIIALILRGYRYENANNSRASNSSQ